MVDLEVVGAVSYERGTPVALPQLICQLLSKKRSGCAAHARQLWSENEPGHTKLVSPNSGVPRS